MITYKHIVGSGMVKTGLAASFSDISSTKIGVEISAGTLSKGGVEYTLAAPVSLELDVLSTMKMDFTVMLTRNVNSPSVIDIHISEMSTRIRQAPMLGPTGFDLVEVLGKGTIQASVSQSDQLNFVEYVFV